MKDKISNLTGYLKVKFIDRTGKEVFKIEDYNLIVNNGYKIAAELLAGSKTAYINRVAVGTSSTVPSLTNTSITNPSYTPVAEVSYPRTGTVQFQFRFGYQDAVGKKINEFGLITEDGRLFSRKTRGTIEKTDQMSIVGVWEINFMNAE